MGVIKIEDKIVKRCKRNNPVRYTAEERRAYWEKHMRVYEGWERDLPEGWTVGVAVKSKGTRALSFFTQQVASLIDDYTIKDQAWEVIRNSYEDTAFERYQFSMCELDEIHTPEQQRKCVELGYVDEITAYHMWPNLRRWLTDDRICRPKRLEYEGQVYDYNKHIFAWCDVYGNSLDDRKRFHSRQEARLSYNRGECTLTDVLRYSYSAVFLVLGDEFQRHYDEILSASLPVSRTKVCHAVSNVHGGVEKQRAKFFDDIFVEHKHKLNNPKTLLALTKQSDADKQIKDKYNKSLYNQLKNNSEFITQFFKENLNKHTNALNGTGAPDAVYTATNNNQSENALDKAIKQYCEHVKAIKTELSNQKTKLVGFTWNGSINQYEPTYAPKPLPEDRFELFWSLVDKVLCGEISGQEAGLIFNKARPLYIDIEHKRFIKTRTQYNTFSLKKYQKTNTKINKLSLIDTVKSLSNGVHELIMTGARASNKTLTAFNYGKFRFLLNIKTGSLRYMQSTLSYSKYLDSSVEQLQVDFADNPEELSYLHKQIKKYNRSMSYRRNVLRHNPCGTEYWEDRAECVRRFLRPSAQVLRVLRKQAKEIIKEYNNYKKEHNITNFLNLPFTNNDKQRLNSQPSIQTA